MDELKNRNTGGGEVASRLPEAAEFEKMSETEQQAIKDFSQKIDVRDELQVRQYGGTAQKRMAEFADMALAAAKNKLPSELAEELDCLAAELRAFEAAEPKKGFLALFTNPRRTREQLLAKCAKLMESVNALAAKLEEAHAALLADVENLSQMYEKNLDHYKLLTMYILAGKMRIARDRETTLASMREIVRRTGLPQDVQAANDFEELIHRFEKKLHDLEITRVVCIQVAPQIRLLQNINTALTDGTQSSLAAAIPLWKERMERVLGVQNGIADADFDLDDFDKLKAANADFMTPLEELAAIVQENLKKRAEAQSELELIDTDLKKKLLELQR